jgi:hypothetical protein
MVREKLRAPSLTRLNGCGTIPLPTPTRRLSFRNVLRALMPLAIATTVYASLPTDKARAGELIDYATIGWWTLAANDGVCRAKAEFDNDTALSVVINHWGALILSVQNPSWRIPEGQYSVVWSIDRAAPMTVTAEAKSNWLYWVIPLNEASVNLMSYGGGLHVTVGRERYSYDLRYSAAVLKKLGECIAPRMQAANPFAGQQSPASSGPASNPFQRM